MTDIFLRNTPSNLSAAVANQDDLVQATAFFHQGRLQQAEALCAKIVAADPNHAEAFNLLAAIALQCDQPTRAADLLQQAILRDDQVREYHHNLGNVLKSLGRLEDAIACFRHSLTLAPQGVDSGYELAVALTESGRHAEAEACFKGIVSMVPEVAEGYHRLGILRLMAGAHALAIVDCRRALVCQPDFTDVHTNLAILLREENQLDQALRSFRHAVLLRPDDANIQLNLGNLLKEHGRQGEFSKILDHAVALSPDEPEFHYSLAMSRSFVKSDHRLAALEKLAEKMPSFDRRAQINAHFALAKIYEDLGDFARSFQHQLDGNKLKRTEIAYDEEAALGHFARIKAVFTKERIAAWRQSGTERDDGSALPIFVLGMPRSGSSLIEQILASHNQVFGAGELLDLANLARALGPDSGPFFPEFVTSMAADDFSHLGADYLRGLKARAPQAARIVDKMPDNFRLIGLIHLALPRAKIIHTRRNALDSCLSIYSKLFSADIPYSYDLTEIGRYWHAYEDLMAHWRTVLPAGTILDVDYEAMVEDQEGQMRRLLAHCGLAWDDACLAFHKTDRVVRTASALQVRQPLYRSSVGRWRPDSDLLAPLIGGLAGR